MKKKVLFALLNDCFGGAEQVIKIIVQYFLEKGYDVEIFFLTKSKGNFWDEYTDNCSVSLIRTSSLNESSGVFQFIKNILKVKHKTYEYAFTSHIYLNSLLSILRGLRLINTKWLIARDSHSYYLVDKGKKLLFYDFLIKIGYKNQDLIISQTEEMKRQLLLNNKRNIKLRGIVKVIKNPFHLPFAAYDASVSLPPKAIVAAGRLIKAKGFDILINSFSKLNHQYDYNLVILGEGPEELELKRLSRDLDMEKFVHFMGFRKDVYSFFKAADVCVVSSRHEGFPNVLLQMMSQNNNVVSTLCAGGISEIDGLVLCKPNDENELYRSLLDAVDAVDNKKNRSLFDYELGHRSVNNFISQVNSFLISTKKDVK